MADKYINEVGVQTIKTWADGKFALDSDLDTLDTKVDEIIAEGGEPNVIETVKVNGTALTPDAQKAVDVSTPTLDVRSNPAGGSGTETTYTVSQGNDSVRFNYMEQGGTLNDYLNVNLGSDLFQLATVNYVNDNGGKIDTISVNGAQQTIINKNVDITVPIKVSDLTNDSNFQTDTQVASTVSTALANSGNPYQTQTEVASAISQAVASAYVYKGSVATVQDLPSTGQTVGDVYDVQATGVNYAWNGTIWDALGPYVDTSVLWTSQTGKSNTLEAMTVAEINAILNA